jgi:hypothetical protein
MEVDHPAGEDPGDETYVDCNRIWSRPRLTRRCSAQAVESQGTSPVPVRELLDQPGFDTGVFVGATFAALLVLVALVFVRHRVAIGGLALCVGVVIAMTRGDSSVHPSPWLLPGLLLLALAGRLSVRLPVAMPIRGALFVPGGLVLTASISKHSDGAFVLLFFLLLVATSTAAADFVHWYPIQDTGMALAAISLAGLYVAVPDTERAAIALGVAIPLALTGWPIRAAHVGPGGAAALVGLLAWLASAESASTPAVVIGAVGCIGVLTYASVMRRAGVNLGQRRIGAAVPAAIPVLATHVLVVAMCSRWAALRELAVASILIATCALVGGALLLIVLYKGIGTNQVPLGE